MRIENAVWSLVKPKWFFKGFTKFQVPALYVNEVLCGSEGQGLCAGDRKATGSNPGALSEAFNSRCTRDWLTLLFQLYFTLNKIICITS